MLARSFQFVALLVFALFATPATAQEALKVVEEGKTKAVVIVDPKAGKWEKRAASDLVKFVELMSGAKPALADTGRESVACHMSIPGSGHSKAAAA